MISEGGRYAGYFVNFFGLGGYILSILLFKTILKNWKEI